MDAIIGIAQNPLVLTLLGAVIKFFPGIRTVIANRFIPVVLAVVAWATQVVGPAEAHAAGFAFGLGGVFASLGAAVWQTAQAWALNEMFLRHVAPPKPADSK